jgi:hypothetical protein
MFLSGVLGASARATAAHSAFVVVGYDAFLTDFQGTSDPTGPGQINLTNGQPGFFNGISGGVVGSEEGNINVEDSQFDTPGITELLALAIQVVDTSGSLHSLSQGNDPALADIINDVNTSSFGGPYAVTAYPFDNLPQQYKSYGSTLASGELQAHGQPFDILASVTYPGQFPPNHAEWGINFSNEVGNLDGINFLEVSDAGAISGPFVPEPASAGLLLVDAAAILGLRRERPKAAT